MPIATCTVAGSDMIEMSDEHDPEDVALFTGEVACHVASAVDPGAIIAQPPHLAADKLGNIFLLAGHAGDADKLLAEGDELGFSFVGNRKQTFIHRQHLFLC
ncbi:MAG: hypothetical protein ONB45_12955 [candidate division KSB1 bacterium]|nr:hypothetical protein [candidate division KSB1 bacterium]